MKDQEYFESADGKDKLYPFHCRLPDESTGIGLTLNIAGRHGVPDGTARFGGLTVMAAIRMILGKLVGIVPPEEFEALSAFSLTCSRKREAGKCA